MSKSLLLALPFLVAGVVSAGAESQTTPATDEGESTFDLGFELDEEAADLEAAEKIFRKSCRGCHGNDAMGASSYPAIGTLEAEYIAEKLVRYRSGEKFGPNSVLMIGAAKKLTDDEIASLAIYVSTAFD